MECTRDCKLCRNLVLSTAIAFTGGNLIITLPAGTFINGCKRCIVLAQAIPDTTTINAPVFITIDGTTTYPLNTRCCSQVVASQLRTRCIYPTRVNTSGTGSFTILRDLPKSGIVNPEILTTTTTVVGG